MALKGLNLILPVLLLVLALHLRKSECSKKFRLLKTVKIYGGKITNVQEYPYLVQVIYHEGPEGIFCAGTLVSPKCILTAAHCFDERNSARSWKVVLGADTRQISAVKSIHKSNLYHSTTLDMDVAILVLEEPMRHFKTVQLNYSDVTVGETVKILGYTYPGHKSQFKDLYEVETKVANAKDYIPEVMTENMFMVMGQNIGTCDGDSGGPVLRYRNQQVGINSHVFNDNENVDCGGRAEKNAAFTKLSSKQVKDFIQNTRKKYC